MSDAVYYYQNGKTCPLCRGELQKRIVETEASYVRSENVGALTDSLGCLNRLYINKTYRMKVKIHTDVCDACKFFIKYPDMNEIPPEIQNIGFTYTSNYGCYHKVFYIGILEEVQKKKLIERLNRKLNQRPPLRKCDEIEWNPAIAD